MEIVQASYLISKPSVADCPPPDRFEFAFIGRSNVGKSSLINMICNYAGLAKTSAQPGKTQMINFFNITSRGGGKRPQRKQWYLVDLPGYGYAKTSQKNRKSFGVMIEQYLRKRKSITSLFVLIDSRHEPQKIDLEFVNQLGEWQLPFAIVFTKADKMKPEALKRNVQLFGTAMQEFWEELPPSFITSATEGDGRDALLGFIENAMTEE